MEKILTEYDLFYSEVSEYITTNIDLEVEFRHRYNEELNLHFFEHNNLKLEDDTVFTKFVYEAMDKYFFSRGITNAGFSYDYEYEMFLKEELEQKNQSMSQSCKLKDSFLKNSSIENLKVMEKDYFDGELQGSETSLSIRKFISKSLNVSNDKVETEMGIAWSEDELFKKAIRIEESNRIIYKEVSLNVPNINNEGGAA